MQTTFRHWQGASLVPVLAAVLAACGGESPLGPAHRAAFPTLGPTAEVAAIRDADLTGCEHLAVPAGSQLAARLYAKGVQIYRWNGTTWAFVAPRADLFADAGMTGRVGIHYAGPYWESVSGSKVRGAVAQRCTPDPTAIQWLLLDVVSNEGPGIFQGVTHIQRVNTVAGLAPAQPGATIGEIFEAPYTTEYLFYRAP